MYIYNVTVNIEESVMEDWLQWMRETHIPDVMETGLFTGNRLCRVMVEEESGVTYSIQYEVKDMETLQLYHDVYAAKLQEEHRKRYENKFVAFRTVLKVEHTYDASASRRK